MIRIYPLDDATADVMPEAIFWRPIRWFSSNIREGLDDFDHFQFITYEIGNWLRFDLRAYRGHPDGTTTLYLPLDFGSFSDVRFAVLRASEELHVPKLAVVWQRGIEFEYGRLDRTAGDRLREPEARLIALKVAALMPNHTATTEQLIEQATGLFSPSGIDMAQSRTRELQPQWHQILRNVISHRTTPAGPFAQGYAVRTRNGLSVTDAGLQYLSTIGFGTIP